MHLHPMLETDRFSWVLLLRLVRLDQGASQVVLVVKNPPADAGDTRDAGSIPGLGRSPGEGNLQYSRLENPVDRGRSLVGYGP